MERLKEEMADSLAQSQAIHSCPALRWAELQSRGSDLRSDSCNCWSRGRTFAFAEVPARAAAAAPAARTLRLAQCISPAPESGIAAAAPQETQGYTSAAETRSAGPTTWRRSETQCRFPGDQRWLRP